MRRRSPFGRTAGRSLVLLACSAAALAGCRQDMHDQAKYEPFEASGIWDDGASARAPIPGTVARGHLREDKAYFSGIAADGAYVAELPEELTVELVARGRSRYDAFCSPCHGRQGDGRGMIVQRGFKQPTSFHDARLQASEVGYLFDVMTRGLGEMSGYSAQLSAHDRWAVAAYVKALQLSRSVPVEALTPEERAELDEPAPPADAPEEHSE